MRKYSKWIIGGVVVLAVAGGVLGSMLKAQPVSAQEVAKGRVEKLVKETGTVEASISVTISAKGAGQVDGISVKEGDSVQAGKLLLKSSAEGVGLDAEGLSAQLTGLSAQYEQASGLAEKNKLLYDQGAISFESYNTSLTTAKQLASQISALRYSIESARQTAGALEIKAPVDGVVTEVFISEGEMVAAGSPLFEICDLSNLYIKADLIAEDADLVKEGNFARIKDRDGNTIDEKATVRKVDIKAQEKTSELGISQKRVGVEIALSNDVFMRLGSDFSVEIITEEKPQALRVPEKAVFEKDKKDFVFVVEGGKARLRQVELGLLGDDYCEVVSGLNEGDTVILSPANAIEEGVRVKP